MDADRLAAERARGWLRPRAGTQGALRYVETIRERWALIVATTLLATLAAAVYVATAPTRYKAEASVLVTPMTSTETATAGLGLITESNDPTQTVSTAAKLIATPSVAALTLSDLGLSGSPQALLAKVSVQPVAQSSLVSVQAEAGSGVAAARLANGFAASAVELATRQLHATIATQLPGLERQLANSPPSERTGPGTLSERVATLQSLANAPNPTVRVASIATVPTSPSSPQKKLALVAGAIGGLILGLGAAFASQALDPRLRREEQLRELFSLPLLAHVPRVRAGRSESPLVPARLTPPAIEAYRALRATVAATAGELHRSILITSSSSGEGKSTTAINYALALAATNRRVLLVEGDLRRPTLADALGVDPVIAGVGAVLINQISMADAVITSELNENLNLLLVERTSVSLADRLSLPTARRLVTEAEALAEYVVIDSPPLTEVVDALPLAQEADAVLIVARIGVTSIKRLASLGEILAQGGVTPTGIVVVGRERLTHSYYHRGRGATVDARVA
jgi:capsular exopolysaccharide synthesis family protein